MTFDQGDRVIRCKSFLTIENNNSNIYSDRSIKNDRGQHSQFLGCFYSSLLHNILTVRRCSFFSELINMILGIVKISAGPKFVKSSNLVRNIASLTPVSSMS